MEKAYTMAWSAMVLMFCFICPGSLSFVVGVLFPSRLPLFPKRVVVAIRWFLPI